MDPYKSVYGINFDVATELIDGPKKFGQIIRKVTNQPLFLAAVCAGQSMWSRNCLCSLPPWLFSSEA